MGKESILNVFDHVFIPYITVCRPYRVFSIKLNVCELLRFIAIIIYIVSLLVLSVSFYFYFD